VEDNPEHIKLIRVLLTREGYHVQSASDANEALAVIKKFKPDLIVMDIQLPGIDGIELTRRLKANPLTAGIKIIAVSAYLRRAEEEKVIRAGCDAYVAKSIDTRNLADLIQEHLKR
jgi:two-component system cell cycle response regulator DivK